MLLLSACGRTPAPEPTPTIDVYAIHTAAALTVPAELTQTAAATTATPQPTIPASEEINILTASPVPTSAETFTPVPYPTETPPPTPTASPEPDEFCDNAIWLADISVQDGTQMSPGQAFEKVWLVQNTGTCTWDEGYKLAFGYGEMMNGQARPIPNTVQPGQEVQMTVVFTAPLAVGEYESYWRMSNSAGANFGDFLFVQIVVR